jgi:hypothetical protein
VSPVIRDVEDTGTGPPRAGPGTFLHPRPGGPDHRPGSPAQGSRSSRRMLGGQEPGTVARRPGARDQHARGPGQPVADPYPGDSAPATRMVGRRPRTRPAPAPGHREPCSPAERGVLGPHRAGPVADPRRLPPWSSPTPSDLRASARGPPPRPERLQRALHVFGSQVGG